jgi:uncharacterized protein (DUF2267 family)
VDYPQFIDVVAQETGLSRPDAERAARATLKTLARRITAGEAEDIAAELPQEVRRWLHDGEHPQVFDRQEFLRRVVAAEGGLIDDATAERHVRGVFAALRRVLSAKEIHDAVAQLPKDIQELVAAGAARTRGAEPA